MDHSTATKNHTVERYLLDELSPGEREDFEEHYFDCAACAEAVRTGAIFAANGRAVVREEAQRPSRPGQVTEMQPRPGRRPIPRWIPSSIAAALLLGTVGVQELRISRLQRQQEPYLSAQAVTRTVLKPQARGGKQVLKQNHNAPTVLTLELSSERTSPAYRVEILHDGKPLDTIENAPARDGGIDIELPANHPAGGYEILVRELAGGLEAGRFSFQSDK